MLLSMMYDVFVMEVHCLQRIGGKKLHGRCMLFNGFANFITAHSRSELLVFQILQVDVKISDFYLSLVITALRCIT